MAIPSRSDDEDEREEQHAPEHPGDRQPPEKPFTLSTVAWSHMPSMLDSMTLPASPRTTPAHIGT